MMVMMMVMMMVVVKQKRLYEVCLTGVTARVGQSTVFKSSQP